MSKNKTFFLISIALVLIPFIGFSRSVEDILTVVLALTIAGLVLIDVRRKRLIGHSTEKHHVQYEREVTSVSENERGEETISILTESIVEDEK